MLPSLRLKVKMREPVAERADVIGDCNACAATLRHIDASVVDKDNIIGRRIAKTTTHPLTRSMDGRS